MTNEITGLPGSKLHNSSESKEVGVQRKEASAAQEESGKPTTTDTVNFTDTAQRLQSLIDSIAKLPVVDTQRVDSIRSALDNGSFEIDTPQVAVKLINFETTVFA